MKRQSSARRQLQRIGILIGIGILAGIGIFVYRFGISGSTPVEVPQNLLNASTAAPAAAATPTPPLQPDGSPYPQIFIPSAEISEYIIESYLDENGWQVNHLGNRVGHLQGTTDIGQSGNVVLAGHVENAEGNPAVFAHIGDLQIGDSVTLKYLSREIHYRVTEVKTVAQEDLSVVYPVEGSDRVTLITCTGYDFVSGVYKERIVVVAERSES